MPRQNTANGPPLGTPEKALGTIVDCRRHGQGHQYLLVDATGVKTKVAASSLRKQGPDMLAARREFHASHPDKPLPSDLAATSHCRATVETETETPASPRGKQSLSVEERLLALGVNVKPSSVLLLGTPPPAGPKTSNTGTPFSQAVATGISPYSTTTPLDTPSTPSPARFITDYKTPTSTPPSPSRSAIQPLPILPPAVSGFCSSPSEVAEQMKKDAAGRGGFREELTAARRMGRTEVTAPVNDGGRTERGEAARMAAQPMFLASLPEEVLAELRPRTGRDGKETAGGR